MADVTNTITSAPILCGVISDTGGTIFDVLNASEKTANKVFNDNFNTCIDLKFFDRDKHWKSYGSLTVAEGRIRLIPRTKFNIRAFVHWLRYRIMMGGDPVSTPFPTGDRDDLIERYNTDRQWMIDTEGMTKNAMPKAFTDKMNWIDYKVRFKKFLNSHTGMNGVLFNYSVRDNVNPIARNNPNLLDYYADRTMLQGKVFTHHSAKVQSCIIHLISENNVSEQNVCPHKIMQMDRSTYWTSRISMKG